MKEEKLFNAHGFSLIELLISLIIISLITASFAPVVTKYFKHRNVTLGAGSGVSTDCSGAFSEDCKLCLAKKACLVCQKSSLSCPLGNYVDTITCKCVSCVADGNCKSCDNTVSCKTCPTDTVLEGGKCTKACPNGTYAPDNNSLSSCINCSSIHANCTKCSEGVCLECGGDYKVKNGTCKKNSTTCTVNYNGISYAIDDAVKFTGAGSTYCMTSTNMGDGAYSDIPLAAGITPITSPNGVCSINSSWGFGANANTKCCWKHGSTAENNTVPDPNPGFDYAPQGRTVCNWWAAMNLCSKITSPISEMPWHLPSLSEFEHLKAAINNDLTAACTTTPKSGNIQKCAGKLGLQLCDRGSSTTSPHCNHNDYCKNSDGSGYCRAYEFFTSTEYSQTHAYSAYFLSGSIATGGSVGGKGTAYSVRCILGPFY